MADSLQFFSCVKIGNELYCTTIAEKILMKINLLSGKLTLLSRLSPTWNGAWFYALYSNFLYMPARNCSCIEKYDTISEMHQTIEWENTNHNSWDCGYTGCFAYQDKLYISPRYDDKIIIYDVKEDRFVDPFILGANCDNLTKKDNEEPTEIYTRALMADNRIWLFPRSQGDIHIYDMDTGNAEQIPLPKKIDGCKEVIFHAGVIYIMDWAERLYVWNEKEDYARCVFDSLCSAPYFQTFAVTDRNIWLLPGIGTDIYIYNLISGKARIYGEYPADFRYEPLADGVSKYRECAFDENKYFVPNQTGNMVLTIDKTTGSGTWIVPALPSPAEWYKFLSRKSYSGEPVPKTIIETERFGLHFFCKALAGNFDDHDEIKMKDCVGSHIWKAIGV